MSTAPTQQERVLRLLRQRGERGITQLDYLAPTADGLAPILRLPARIADLRRRGHAIRSRLVTLDGGARVALYTLARQRPLVEARPEHVEPAPLALDLDAPVRRPISPYDADVEGC